jgi:kinesin family protein 18/19
VEYKDKNSGTEAEIKQGKLSLIDLAGSERASATQNRGIRLIEGANINRSLLTLGNCINALCEVNEKGHKVYVPYRDSKLTRLLKDSLGGNSRTVMIANISPSATCFEDTSNTLKYANRAKKIKTHVNRNVLNVQYHISNYNDIIKNLKNEVSELRNLLGKKNGSNDAGYSPENIKSSKYIINFKETQAK